MDKNQSEPKVEDIEMKNMKNSDTEPCRFRYKRVKSEAEIKRQLDKHFANPYTICINAGIRGCPKSMPKKLVIMVLKWTFVTAQLLKFGNNRMDFAKFQDRNNIALKNLVMKNWITQYETMPYPHATGIYAVYADTDLIEYIQYSAARAQKLPEISVGSFFVSSRDNTSYIPVDICIKSYKMGKFDNEKREINIDPLVTEECTRINSSHAPSYDIIKQKLQPIMRSEDNLVRVLVVKLIFNVDSVHIIKHSKDEMSTKCFTINTKIIFDNSEMNGQIPISMKTSVDEFTCSAKTATRKVDDDDIFLFVVVGLLSVVSIMVCGISLKKSLFLCYDTRNFFLMSQPHPLSRQGMWEIVKCRDIVMLISDIHNLVGSVLKYRIDTQTLSSASTLYDVCGITLGIGSFLVWLGMMRFLAYDKGFNLLFSVMERSFIPILRFLACALLFFVAFSLSGWVVLSPYHIKFTTLTKTTHCFFALLFGDEIFVTMNTLMDVSLPVVVYNDFIIGIYLVLFALVAMNIIIAIFNSTYENIRTRNNEVLQSDLMEFMGHKPLL